METLIFTHPRSFSRGGSSGPAQRLLHSLPSSCQSLVLETSLAQQLGRTRPNLQATALHVQATGFGGFGRSHHWGRDTSAKQFMGTWLRPLDLATHYPPHQPEVALLCTELDYLPGQQVSSLQRVIAKWKLLPQGGAPGAAC